MTQAAQYWNAFSTIVRKEIRRFVRIWVQTVLPPTVTTALYFLIFGTLIGGEIGQMGGMNYIDFIVPGLILMSVIVNSYGNVVSSFYSSKFQRYVDELLIAPVPNWIILAGYVVGGMARGLAVGLVVTVVSMLFTEFKLHSLWVAMGVFLLTSALFSTAGMINAIYAKSFDDIALIPNFVLTPLTYLGGIFYSIDMLPSLWRDLSLFNPVLYMINAFRFGLSGVSDIPVLNAFVIVFAFDVALIAFALWLLHKGVGLKN